MMTHEILRVSNFEATKRDYERLFSYYIQAVICVSTYVMYPSNPQILPADTPPTFDSMQIRLCRLKPLTVLVGFKCLTRSEQFAACVLQSCCSMCFLVFHHFLSLSKPLTLLNSNITILPHKWLV